MKNFDQNFLEILYDLFCVALFIIAGVWLASERRVNHQRSKFISMWESESGVFVIVRQDCEFCMIWRFDSWNADAILLHADQISINLHRSERNYTNFSYFVPRTIRCAVTDLRNDHEIVTIGPNFILNLDFNMLKVWWTHRIRAIHIENWQFMDYICKLLSIYITNCDSDKDLFSSPIQSISIYSS